MVQSAEELTVAQRLGQLLDRGLLPAGGPAEAAERLIERLERPARVALLGLPGSGKSAILNLLTGAVVVPETLRLPTIIVQHGTEARMLCTLTDGHNQSVPGSDLNDVLSLNPALVTLEMDLPALKVISLLEVSAGPMEAEQRRAAIWASKRADILIWCTTSYLPKEQQVWESMPDVVKDNGFLFLTKTDLLGSREAAAGMLERVETRAGEEFRQVLSISAKQARAAMPPGAPVDRDLFRDSGAAAMIGLIKNRVQAARRADTDTAELLLARHVEAGGIVARRFAEPDNAAQAPAAVPQWNPPPEASIEPEPAPMPEPAAEPESVVELPSEAVAKVGAPSADHSEQPATWSEPETEPGPESEPDPVDLPDAATVFQSEADEQQPSAPEPMPADSVAQRPIVEDGQDQQPSTERKRFSDRIKQMPVPEAMADAPQVPLRTTWKSKAETSAAKASGASAASTDPDETKPVRSERSNGWAASSGPVVSRPAPAPRAPLEPEDTVDDDRLVARMMESGTPVAPEYPEEPEEILAEAEEEGVEAAAEIDPDAEAETARWAERLAPADAPVSAERSARTSLFGSRKPVAPPPQAARPGERAVRPAEPAVRVRSPAPRQTEAPKPVSPSPEELATPRFAGQRERLSDAIPEAAGVQRAERRERPRIAARIGAIAAPAAEKPAALPSDEQEVLDAAIQKIVARAEELAAAINPDEKIPVDMILDHSRETTEQVIAILSVARSSGLRRIVGDLGEIQDLIMLMQLEKGHAPADDALTLLLQIRRDLETLRAA